MKLEPGHHTGHVTDDADPTTPTNTVMINIGAGHTASVTIAGNPHPAPEPDPPLYTESVEAMAKTPPPTPAPTLPPGGADTETTGLYPDAQITPTGAFATVGPEGSTAAPAATPTRMDHITHWWMNTAADDTDFVADDEAAHGDVELINYANNCLALFSANSPYGRGQMSSGIGQELAFIMEIQRVSNQMMASVQRGQLPNDALLRELSVNAMKLRYTRDYNGWAV